MRKLLFFMSLSSLFLGVGKRAAAQLQPATTAAFEKKTDAWLKDDAAGFMENKGQLRDQNGNENPAVKYLLNMPGLNVQLRPAGFSYDTWVEEKSKGTRRKFHRVDIELEGATPNAVLTADKPLVNVNNMVSGQSSFKNIHSFRTVTYHNIYPGIDLEFVAKKGTDKPVEYNFIVHPGADASLIRMKYSGQNSIGLKQDNIEMELDHGTLSEHIPASWLPGSGKRLDVHYEAIDKNIYAFRIPAYDRSETLIIDPTPNLEWATYYGGSALDEIAAVTTDSLGNIYVVGFTASSSNIATAGAYDGTYGGNSPNEDVFIAKFNTIGQRIWGTYYGGSARDSGTAITVRGNVVYIGGTTSSSGMATAGAHQTTQTAAGQRTGFLAKFDAGTGQLSWGTYYGGSMPFQPSRIAVDDQADFYVYGGFLTGSSTTPTGVDVATAGTFRPTLPAVFINQENSALVKFNASGVRQWGTYIDYSTNSPAVTSYVGAMDLDANGQIYVAGATTSTTLAGNASQGQTYAGAGDAYLLKIDKTNGQRTWGRYFGGSANSDYIHDIYVDKTNQIIYAAGQTKCASGIATPGTFIDNIPVAIETAGILVRGGFLASFDLNGTQVMGTYLNNTITAQTIGLSVTQDNQGNIYVYGQTNEALPNMATNCSYITNPIGSTDIFVNRFTAQGQRVWGTYLGTTAADFAYGFSSVADARGKSITTDPQGNVIVDYNTSVTGGATAGAFQASFAGGTYDGVIAKLNAGTVPQDAAVVPSTLSPMSQTGCILGIPATITGNAVSLYNPPGYTSPVFYQWQVANAAAGPWVNMSGEVFKDLQPLSASTAKYYRRLVLLNNGYCDTKIVDSSAVASVLVNSNTAPIASADGPQWYVCSTGANTVTLNGSAAGGSGTYTSYQWYAGSNLTTPVASTAAYTPTVTSTTTYTLKVTDNAGCVDVDQVTVVPVIANAGPDVSMCENSGGVQIGSAGIPGGAITYSWATVSGSPVSSLSCANCAQPIASPTTTSTYQVTATVTRKDGTTCSTTDNVTVTFVTSPTGGSTFGGTDKTICKNSSVTLGGVNDASATYSWSPTSYLSASNIYNPTFNAGTNTVACPVVYTVTAAKSGCTFTDQVNVNVIDASTSLDSQTVSCQAWSDGNTNNCSGATYTWQLVSGPGVVPTGARLRNGGADAYLVNTAGSGNAVYQRTTTVNGVNCTSGPVTISPCGGGGGCPVISIQMLTPQGCPKVFGQQVLQLYVSGINAADYYFSWTPAGIMDNPAAPIVNITATTAATVGVTVTNKYTGQVCTAPGLPINNPSWSLPVLNVSDKATCPGTAVAIGEPTASGFTYAWSPATGLNSAAIANPVASLSVSGSYSVTKTDNTNGCKATKTVTVDVSDINYDAGPNHAVCNGATVTLGTTPGGSYTYSWTPVNAAWTNGTGPTDANPQVLFAGSSQTFHVTVTNPATGCLKTDTVTLSGTVLPGEYAGPAVGPLCPGATTQLGTTPVANASYSWSPASGLSCTTCANPVVTAGSANQTYSVTVSYPGCVTPVTDNMTVSVNSLPAVTLTNKNICPSAPANIGIGGTGNTASLTGVSSYSWTPATNLSCTNCASPDASPVTATTYTVLITFTNGCTLQNQVTVTPTVRATAKPDATICPGGSVVLGSPAVANVTYSWSIVSGTAGSITPTNVAQPVANPAATSVYRLTATGTGPNAGCTITDDVQVTVKTLPSFSITGNTSVCTGGTITLSVSPVATNTMYQWSPTTGVSSPGSTTTTIMPVANTAYRVTQTDLNSGCSDYKEAVVTVWPNNVTATGGSITVCPASAATMPLTVSPASGNTIVWSPATYLNNPYTQNPVITPQASGNYTATVTNTTSNCSDTALVTVTVPATCLAYDFGDAPAIYENGNPASHGVISALKIGGTTDAEGAPQSAAMNAPAVGDDDNNVINDEEGISFLPGVNTASKTVGMLMNSVLNNTGSTAYLVAWIDFNHDGDFDDAGERSSILTVASSAAATSPVLQFSGFNTGCVVISGPSYLRVRLTTDTSGSWNTNPSPNGARANGEVEDYAITIYGTDFSDAPAMYPTARATVNPDLNNDGKPDAAGSVWLGAIVDYPGCDAILSNLANGDDNNGMSDEDGLNMNGGISTGNTTATWDVTVNSQGPVSNVQWGMWVDWNIDGVFDAFYHDSVNTASPVVVPVSVTSPASIAPNYIVRLGVKTGTAFTATDYALQINNGEWEDFIGAPIPLSATLLSFTATKKTATTAVLQWETSHEEQSDYFVVERSADARTWNEIDRVKAAVKSETQLSYSTTDNAPLRGVNYYRLRIMDKDGSYKLSAVRQLTFGSDMENSIGIIPNPARDMASVVFAQPTTTATMLRIWNNLGQVIYTCIVPPLTRSYKLSLPAAASGIYQVSVDGDGIAAHVKLVIQ